MAAIHAVHARPLAFVEGEVPTAFRVRSIRFDCERGCVEATTAPLWPGLAAWNESAASADKLMEALAQLVLDGLPLLPAQRGNASSAHFHAVASTFKGKPGHHVRLGARGIAWTMEFDEGSHIHLEDAWGLTPEGGGSWCRYSDFRYREQGALRIALASSLPKLLALRAYQSGSLIGIDDASVQCAIRASVELNPEYAIKFISEMPHLARYLEPRDVLRASRSTNADVRAAAAKVLGTMGKDRTKTAPSPRTAPFDA